MPVLNDVVRFLEEFAPPRLAEEWDNVGLLVGDRNAEATSILTCLTLTPDVAAEAINAGCRLIVAHHPILFRAVKRISADTAEGEMLLRLIQAGVAVYSPHTSYDSSAAGINQQLAADLGLRGIQPLRPEPATGEAQRESIAAGGGRCGELESPIALGELINRIKRALAIERLQFVGDLSFSVARLAIACGSAAEFLPDARRAGCQALLTGEARFHACLEAREAGIALILAGHYATERPAMERLAAVLAEKFPNAAVRASAAERDPLRWA